jgi:ADP-ribose pyrophosphatase YjhB (NUDIX family)
MEKGIDYIGISVGAFMHDGKGRYLVGLRTDKCRDEHNRWEPAGGGGLKFGEKIIEGVVREAKEEVGTVPFNLEFLGNMDTLRVIDGTETHWLTIYYKAQVNPNEVKIMEPDMCAELRWCIIDEIPQPMHSQFHVFLEKYKDKL